MFLEKKSSLRSLRCLHVQVYRTVLDDPFTMLLTTMAKANNYEYLLPLTIKRQYKSSSKEDAVNDIMMYMKYCCYTHRENTYGSIL